MVLQVLGWVSEKLQVASDESYRDPTNLQGKLQKHQAFEAEVMANRKRVDVVSAVSSFVNSYSLIAARCLKKLHVVAFFLL